MPSRLKCMLEVKCGMTKYQPSKHAKVGPTSVDIGIKSASRQWHADVGQTSAQPRQLGIQNGSASAEVGVPSAFPQRQADAGPTSARRSHLGMTNGSTSAEVGVPSASRQRHVDDGTSLTDVGMPTSLQRLDYIGPTPAFRHIKQNQHHLCQKLVERISGLMWFRIIISEFKRHSHLIRLNWRSATPSTGQRGGRDLPSGLRTNT